MGNAPSGTHKVAPGDVLTAPWDLGQGSSLVGGPVKNPVHRPPKGPVPGVNLSGLKRIDEHVRKTPPAATKSLQSLAAYISSAATTDLERARAAYKWIVTNVEYDVEGLRGTKPRAPCDADSVLKNRLCVCAGYASIMLRLCQLLHVECVEIVGYSKGVGHDPKKSLKSLEPDHVWNAVKLDGKWKLVECTWGAGHLDEQHVFQKYPNDFCFLTDPEIFVEAHLPCVDFDVATSKKWQLLDKPIDLKTFHSRVQRKVACIEHQVELVSHQQALIDVDSEVSLKFKGAGKPLNSFCATFRNPSTKETLDCGRFVATILDHRINEATVTARPPSRGAYWELQVFGTTEEGATKKLQLLVSYLIRRTSSKRLPEFPDYDGFYGLHQRMEKHGFTSASLTNKLYSGQAFWLKLDRGVHVMKIPILKPINATATLQFAEDSEPDRRACALEVTDKFLTISLRMKRSGFYKLDLFGAELDSSEQHQLASFLIECEKPLKDRILFPDFEGFYGIFTAPEQFGFTSDFPVDRRFYIREADGEFELKFPTSAPVYAHASLSIADAADGKDGFTFLETEEGSLKISVRMDRLAFYKLTLYCAKLGSTGNELPMFANFLIKCVKPLKQLLPFPQIYYSALEKRVTLESPRDGELPANSRIRFKLASSTLKSLLVQKAVHYSTATGFDFFVKTGAAGTELTVFGSTHKKARDFEALYGFRIV